MDSEQEYVIISQNLSPPDRIRIRKFRSAIGRGCTIDFQKTISGNLVVLRSFQTEIIVIPFYKGFFFVFF